MKDLNNKVAVVTGAGSGIGRGIAEHAAKAGMRLVLADINEESLNETLALVKSFGVEAISRVTDVSSLDEVENLASQVFLMLGLFCIGTQFKVQELKSISGKPLILALILWIMVIPSAYWLVTYF